MASATDNTWTNRFVLLGESSSFRVILVCCNTVRLDVFRRELFPMTTSFYGTQISVVPACGVVVLPAEHAAGSSCSASCYETPEHILILAMVMAERKLSQIERQILAAHLMKVADHTALEQRPERFNRIGMDVPAHVFLGCVVDDFVRQAQMAIGWILVGDNKFHAALGNSPDEAIVREVGLLAHHLADDVTLAADRANDAFFQVAFARPSHALLAVFLAQRRFLSLPPI